MLEKIIGKPSFSFVVNNGALKSATEKRNYKELFGASTPVTDEGEIFRPAAR